MPKAKSFGSPKNHQDRSFIGSPWEVNVEQLFSRYLLGKLNLDIRHPTSLNNSQYISISLLGVIHQHMASTHLIASLAATMLTPHYRHSKEPRKERVNFLKCILGVSPFQTRSNNGLLNLHAKRIPRANSLSRNSQYLCWTAPSPLALALAFPVQHARIVCRTCIKANVD